MKKIKIIKSKDINKLEKNANQFLKDIKNINKLDFKIYDNNKTGNIFIIFIFYTE